MIGAPCIQCIQGERAAATRRHKPGVRSRVRCGRVTVGKARRCQQRGIFQRRALSCAPSVQGDVAQDDLEQPPTPSYPPVRQRTLRGGGGWQEQIADRRTGQRNKVIAGELLQNMNLKSQFSHHPNAPQPWRPLPELLLRYTRPRTTSRLSERSCSMRLVSSPFSLLHPTLFVAHRQEPPHCRGTTGCQVPHRRCCDRPRRQQRLL